MADEKNFAPGLKLQKWMRDIRREIHRCPELGYNEHKTSELIAGKLREMSVPCRIGVAGTGVLATLGESRKLSSCVALRADMDALPVQEKTGLPFSSQCDGIMHACGHDGHVAILLGACALLRPVSLPGSIRLIFQPAEEGKGGAKAMIAEGALDGVDAVFGGHIDRHFRVGELAVEPGIICAYTDKFVIEVKGRGGHAAKPHETVDSIVVASQLVMSIQTLVSREVNPSYPSVVSVGRIAGGTVANVIAESTTLEGTIRTTHTAIRKKIIAGLTRMVDAMENLYQAEMSITITKGYPPIINDPTATEVARVAARNIVGVDGVKGLAYPSLGGEDFSYYLQKVPGCFVRFGAQKKGYENFPAHSPSFDFDEKVLPIGAAFLAQVAVTALHRIAELRKAHTLQKDV